MTLVDAQVSFPQILKPIPNFEQVYQGIAGNTAIAFPGGIDDLAAKATPGYAPNLQKGISVPYGARLTIWIPLVVGGGANSQLPAQMYQYQFIWRLRNVVDYAENRTPYHIKEQNPGIPDTTSGVPVPRFIVVPGSQSILYEQPALPDTVLVLGNPVNIGAGGQSVVQVRDQIFQPRGGTEPGLNTAAPLDAAGNPTLIGQGVLDPATTLGGTIPSLFNVFRCDAEGDELIILATRSPNPTASPAQSATWDFVNDDFGFAMLYGTGAGAHDNLPNLGIYVFAGTNP